MGRSQADKLDVILEDHGEPSTKARPKPTTRKLVIRLLPLIDENLRSIMRSSALWN